MDTIVGAVITNGLQNISILISVPNVKVDVGTHPAQSTNESLSLLQLLILIR